MWRLSPRPPPRPPLPPPPPCLLLHRTPLTTVLTRRNACNCISCATFRYPMITTKTKKTKIRSPVRRLVACISSHHAGPTSIIASIIINAHRSFAGPDQGTTDSTTDTAEGPPNVPTTWRHTPPPPAPAQPRRKRSNSQSKQNKR